MMIPVLMVWLYFAMLVSAMQWPDIHSMIIYFILLGFIPVFMLYRLLIAKRRSRQGNDKPGSSMHVGVSEVNQHNTGENE